MTPTAAQSNKSYKKIQTDKQMHPVTESLTLFMDAYMQAHPRLVVTEDMMEPSPCTENMHTGYWRPCRQTTSISPRFNGLETALDCPIHEDLKAYYSSFWSGSCAAESQEGYVSLLFLWNAEDTDRLLENLLGHALQQRQQKLQPTWFFACTEPDSPLFLSIDNASGAVLLETPGEPPIRSVADNLSDFLLRLKPATQQDLPK